jgi:hypothetical protein
MNETVMVRVYNSPDKTAQLHVLPITDLGIASSNGFERSSDASLVNLIKMQLRSQGRHSDAELELFHYEVERH